MEEYKEIIINNNLSLVEQYGYKFYLCKKLVDSKMFACSWALIPIKLLGKCCYDFCYDIDYKELDYIQNSLKEIGEKNRYPLDFWVAEVVKMCGKIVPKGTTIEEAKTLDCSATNKKWIHTILHTKINNDRQQYNGLNPDLKAVLDDNYKPKERKHSKIILPDIVLTDLQQKAVDIAYQNIANFKQITTIAGYAGTGKSTIVLFLIDKLAELDIYLEDVAFCTFTGKAARVLTSKGTPAVTLHKLMYDPVEDKKTGEIHFVLKDNLKCKLVVIDECSMLPKNMLDQLLAFGVPCVFFGDPFQLPPLDPKQDNHLLDKPDIFLTEVMRQAKDSGIIKLATLIREGKDWSNFRSNQAIVISTDELNNNYLKNADIILTSTNKKRNTINRKLRRLLKRKGIVDVGEKVICCKNYWDTTIENSLTNGLIGTLSDIDFADCNVSRYKIPAIFATFISEDGLNKLVRIDKNFLQTEEPSINQKQLLKLSPLVRKKVPYQFTYAYAITGHKAQGSEWDKVLVFEEEFPFVEHNRWLYTCITRARQKVILVHK